MQTYLLVIELKHKIQANDYYAAVQAAQDELGTVVQSVQKLDGADPELVARVKSLNEAHLPLTLRDWVGRRACFLEANFSADIVAMDSDANTLTVSDVNGTRYDLDLAAQIDLWRFGKMEVK